MSVIDFDAIEGRLQTLPGGAEGLRARQHALCKLRDLGFPSRALEAWRYSDLKPLIESGYELFPHPPSAAQQGAAELAAAANLGNGIHWVFVDGRYTDDLSHGTWPQGVDWRCEEYPRTEPDDPAKASPHSLNRRFALAAFNAALTRSRIRIELAPGIRIEQPVHLHFISSMSSVVLQPRIELALGAESAATILLHYGGLAQVAGWTNAVHDISQAAGSTLTLYELQEHSHGYHHTGTTRCELAEGARLRWRQLDLGGSFVRHDIEIALTEPRADAELLGLVSADQRQHMDIHVHIAHAAPTTCSVQAFRGMVGANSRAVVNGKVVVHEDAQGIDAAQSIDGLLLADGSEFDAKPELEIYADNVKCSHGTTVGEIDEEQLFYLRARGLGSEEARSLLLFAFANTLLRRLEWDSVRERVARRIAGGFMGSMDMEGLS